jgi:arylsulfatase A-like enzyme
VRLLAAALAPLLLAGCSAPPPPNLLLVTIDTLRADRLTCYGGPAGAGARICALFDGGWRFRWAFSTAPYTTPSVASLLTSRYPAFHGVTQSPASYLGNDELTVAEALLRAGYTTAAFVSNPVLDRRRALGQGFEIYDQRMTRRERNRPGYAEREAAATTDAALAWAQVKAREPWFLWVHFQDPHGPYEPPGSSPPADPPGARLLPVLEDHSGRGGIPWYQQLPGTYSQAAYERGYLDEIAYLDPHVARLVAGVDALGRPPAIVLTSDHGEAFGEDGYYFAHGHSVGLDQIRVPLFFRPARASMAGGVIDTPVSLVDVAPTLLRLADVAVPASYQGRPLPIAGVGSVASEPRAIFAEHGRQAAIVRGDRFYSRDRDPFEGRLEVDLGNEMPALPPRTARLRNEDALPPYEAVTGDGPDEELETQLGAFLHETRGLRGLRREQVPEDIRERMRALGYVEG